MNLIEDNALISKTISYLRFPLTLGVIYIHATLSDIIINGKLVVDSSDIFPVYYTLSYLISHILARVCVPIFFVISGFLFFNKVDKFSPSIYLNKCKSRVRSLFTPYIFWNLVCIISYALMQVLFEGLLSGRNKLIQDYDLLDYISCFWDMSLVNELSSTNPINYPLWYIRDLMVTILISPLIYIVIKSPFKSYYLLLLIILYITNFDIGIIGLNITGILFFSLGVFFAVGKFRLSNILRYSNHFLTSYLVIVAIEFFTKDFCNSPFVHRIGVLVGIVAVVTFVAKRISMNSISLNNLCTNSSFFLFAFHALPLGLLLKIVMHFINTFNDITLVLVYLFSPIVIVLLGIIIFYILNKYFPRLTDIITGCRKLDCQS